MERDERESLLEELHDAHRLAIELTDIRARALKRVGRGRPGTAAYQWLADQLHDAIADFQPSAEFASMRRALEADEQADADQEAGQQRRAYERSVL